MNDHTATLTRLVGFYKHQLEDSKEACEFLVSQKLDIKTVKSTYLIGYSKGTLGEFVQDSPEFEEQLKELGVLDENGNETLAGCLTLPLYEAQEIVGLAVYDIKGNRTRTIGTTASTTPFESLFNYLDDTQTTRWELLRKKYDIKHVEKKAGRLTVTLKVTHKASKRFVLDTVNLFSAKQRQSFATQVARLLSENVDPIEDELFELVEGLDSGEFCVGQGATPVIEMSEEDKQSAQQFLESPNLFQELLDDFESLGYIGEPLNKQLAYLVMTSRKTQNPLSLIIMSTSAAGKSTLQKTMFDVCPPEDRKHFTRMTAQSLYYLGEESLKHKFLSIEEDEGSTEASYALKILLSAKEINVSSTGQDPNTGQKRTNEIKTEGPVSVIVSTTKSDVEPELASRAMMVTIDESSEQTERIHLTQREGRTLEGRLKRRQKDALYRKHHAVQRLLRTELSILNPHVDSIHFPTDRLKYRRGQEQLLNLVDTIAFLRQYQKKTHHHEELGPYIEVEIEDIELAQQLFEVSMQWVSQDLKPNAQKLLADIKRLCQETDTSVFHRRQLREQYKWETTNLHRQLKQLVELEYIRLKHRSAGLPHVYELLESC
jgi:hypothetical protein